MLIEFYTKHQSCNFIKALIKSTQFVMIFTNKLTCVNLPCFSTCKLHYALHILCAQFDYL